MVVRIVIKALNKRLFSIRYSLIFLIPENRKPSIFLDDPACNWSDYPESYLLVKSLNFEISAL
jgi:hypothetical protein